MATPSQNIWEQVYVQHKLSTRMPELAASPDGTTFLVHGHGKVRIFAHKTSAMGENYMSDAYAVRIQTYDGTEHSAFVKVLPANPVLREAAYMSKVYDREVGAYSHLIPRIEEFKQKKGIAKDQVPIALPGAHFVFLDEFVKGERDGLGTVIVLEDLKVTGHKTIDKKPGCDYTHANLTLQALANFHAASVAYVRHHFQDNQLKNFPQELDFLRETSFFEETCPQMIRAIIPMHVSILRAHNMHKDAAWVEKELLPNLETAVSFQDKLEDCGSLPAILHGDMWSNNIMYRYHDDQVKAATLVDWQIIRFGHPVSDLLYFLFSSTTFEMRAKHLDQLLEDYFTTLSSKLALFGINLEQEGYTLEKFRQDAEKRYVWGMMMAFMILPMILDMKVADKLKEYESEENKALLDASAQDLMADSEQKFKELYTTDFLLQNKLLCQRITEMVPEVRKVVNKAK